MTQTGMVTEKEYVQAIPAVLTFTSKLHDFITAEEKRTGTFGPSEYFSTQFNVPGLTIDLLMAKVVEEIQSGNPNKAGLNAQLLVMLGIFLERNRTIR